LSAVWSPTTVDQYDASPLNGQWNVARTRRGKVANSSLWGGPSTA
jgi:hypothetical protein